MFQHWRNRRAVERLVDGRAFKHYQNLEATKIQNAYRLLIFLSLACTRRFQTSCNASWIDMQALSVAICKPNVLQVPHCAPRVLGAARGSARKATSRRRASQKGKRSSSEGEEGEEAAAQERAAQEKSAAATVISREGRPAKRRAWSHLHGCSQG